MRKILQSTYVLPVPSQWDFSEPVFPDKFFFLSPPMRFFIFLPDHFPMWVWFGLQQSTLYFSATRPSHEEKAKMIIIIYTQRTSKKNKIKKDSSFLPDVSTE